MKSFPEFTIGLHVNYTTDIQDLVKNAFGMGFQFISTHIIQNKYAESAVNDPNYGQVNEPFAFDDTELSSDTWSQQIVGVVSDLEPTIQSSKNNMTILNKVHEVILDELSYCEHLSLQNVVVEVNNHDCVKLAEVIGGKILASTRSSFAKTPMNYWIKLPAAGNDDTSDQEHPWSTWYKFKTLTGCENSRYLCLAIELGSNAPTPDEFDRWFGEPLKAVYISTSVFLTNSKGFPVLSRPHQDFIRTCFRRRVPIILQAENIASNLKYFVQYIEHLKETSEKDIAELYHIHHTYQNSLQIPLQPLHDNLESQIYQTFEKDPVKYDLYEKAIFKALVDKTQSNAGESETQNPMILMVVGAGRGPLVRRCLVAADTANVKVHVYAVEKNRNAANCLHYLIKKELFEGRTTIVHQDMRNFNPEHKADIIVSELLGSFGDNELAPECLDGAERFLKDDGIMIPQTYSSYIGPISSAVLHREVALLHQDPAKISQSYESPYVVSMGSKFDIASAQKLYTFNSPNKGYSENETGIGEFKNERFTELCYNAKMDCVLHGFAGYFECTLYGDVLMSIYPPTFSTNMFSWFPIYFPIQHPMMVKANDKITLLFWRKLDPHKRRVAWYEWTVTSPQPSPIHNLSGEFYTMNF